MKRETVIQGGFIALCLLALYECFVIAEPFLTPLLGAIVLAIVSFPVHRAICRGCPWLQKSARAALSTLVIVAITIVPFAIALSLLIGESSEIIPRAQATIQELYRWGDVFVLPWIAKWLPILQRWPPFAHLNVETLRKGLSMLSGISFSNVGGFGRVLAVNALLTALNLAVLVFALFFLLRDGETVLGHLKRWLPLQARDKERILRRVETTVLGIVRGSVLTAIFQSICATIGYFVVGVPGALMLGIVTGVATVIPVLGTALIWAPTAIYLLMFSSAWKGIFLFIWGAAVVSLTDNLVRTYFIGRESRLPLFLLFLGIVGGVRVYGLRGLLIGPLLVAVIPVLLDIFEVQYLTEK